MWQLVRSIWRPGVPAAYFFELRARLVILCGNDDATRVRVLFVEILDLLQNFSQRLPLGTLLQLRLFCKTTNTYVQYVLV